MASERASGSGTGGTVRVRRRLLLRVSTRRDVEAGLETSLTLASAFQGELSALFVEEEAPLQASALPFPTIVSFSGGMQAMEPSRIEAALRREAETCRRLLAEAADRARLAWSFHAGRGEALRLLRESASADDILVLRLDQIGLPAWEVLGRARSLAPSRGGILLLPARLAPAAGGLRTLGGGREPAPALRQAAAQLAEALHLPLEHVRLQDGMPGELALRLAGARLLVARLESPLLDDPQLLRGIAAALRRPLLLLRTEPAEG